MIHQFIIYFCTVNIYLVYTIDILAGNNICNVGADLISAPEPKTGASFRAEIDSAPTTRGANIFDVEYIARAAVAARRFTVILI